MQSKNMVLLKALQWAGSESCAVIRGRQVDTTLFHDASVLGTEWTVNEPDLYSSQSETTAA